MPEENAEQQKPVGPFDDFQSCVSHFEGDPDVDDPQALCGWMEQNGGKSAVQEYQPDEDAVQDLVDEMKTPAASSVLTDLEVTYVSGVADPAQDSQWVMAKDASTHGADWGVTTPLMLTSDHEVPTVWTDAARGAYAKALHERLVEKQPDSVSEMDFSDYPQAAQENAQMALEAREDTGNPNDCGTDVGWARANQLADGENLSPETVGRMANFRRHQDNAEMDDDEGRSDCGWMMWNAWGGEAGVAWAEQKMEALEDVREKAGLDRPVVQQEPAEGLEDACWDGYVAVGLKPNPNGEGMVPDCVPEDEVEQSQDQPQGEAEKGCATCVPDTTTLALEGEQADEQQKAWAPVLIPSETDKQGDVIPPESIEMAAHDFLAQFRNIDTDHDLLEGKGVPIESWTLKEASTFTLPDGSESREYPAGTWMLGVEFSDEAWDRIKSGELSGFSIYGEATEHDVQDLLGGGVDLEMGGAVQAFETAKEADSSTTDMTDPDTENGEGSTEKQMPADAVPILVDTLNAYLASEDEDLDADLESWLQWGLDSGEIEADSIEIDGEELTAEGGGSEAEDEGGEGGDMGEGGPEQPPEETQMSENPEDDPSEGESSTKELLEDVRDTVKSTQESVEQHGDRISALEDQVFEKEQNEQGEGQEQEGEQPTSPAPDEVKQEAEQAATEAAENQVKNLLGLEDLPDDPEDRQEVVRKHFHEQPEDGESLGNPDEWTEDEVNGVVR